MLKRIIEQPLISLKSQKPLRVKQRKYIKDLPYYSQWESPKLVKKILTNKISALDDPLWKKSGANTKEEYFIWSWSGCGMACLKMILKDKFKKEYKLVTLGRKCLEYGGYIDNSNKYDLESSIKTNTLDPNYLNGLFYKEFLNYIKSEFNLTGKIIRPMSINDIVSAIDKKSYVIASVNPSIRNPEKKPKKKGGHLVLITGYDLNKKNLYLHNPSGIYEKSQQNFEISFKDFNKFFANRGVIIN